jgi:hypothetical protein
MGKLLLTLFLPGLRPVAPCSARHDIALAGALVSGAPCAFRPDGSDGWSGAMAVHSMSDRLLTCNTLVPASWYMTGVIRAVLISWQGLRHELSCRRSPTGDAAHPGGVPAWSSSHGVPAVNRDAGASQFHAL